MKQVLSDIKSKKYRKDNKKGTELDTIFKNKTNKNEVSLRLYDPQKIKESVKESGILPNLEKQKRYDILSDEKKNFTSPFYQSERNDIKPSIYFYKFLARKPEYEFDEDDNNKKKHASTLSIPYLRLNIPDTIVMNDPSSYWIYTDLDGYVKRVDEKDGEVVEKFQSDTNDENELIGICKSPINSSRGIENAITLLNYDELEKCLFGKSGTAMAIQRFIKCRGPNAFVCRTHWIRDKSPSIYIFTNKFNYHNTVKNQEEKFIVNTAKENTYYCFYSTSGKHLEETSVYMNNIVKFIENHSNAKIAELVGDFVKDEAGIWWFINMKAVRLVNEDDDLNFSYFFTSRDSFKSNKVIRRFDYQTKTKCKFCGVENKKTDLKYKLTTQMILETSKMYSHVDFPELKKSFKCLDRPDLKHDDYSMIYLPYRVCENCYLLFETLHDIKEYQMKIAKLFRCPVNDINFGFGYYLDPSKRKKSKSILEEEKDPFASSKTKLPMISSQSKRSEERTKTARTRKIEVTDKSKRTENTIREEDKKDEIDADKEYKSETKYRLYRILIMINDLDWNENVQIPEKEDLYIIYNFLDKDYKVQIEKKEYNKDLDYSIINYAKLFHIITEGSSGFLNFSEKQKTMKVQIGYFIDPKKEIKEDRKKLLNSEIIIEDNDIVSKKSKENFYEYASLDLSLQGLKYGPSYRNQLNGLIFKQDEPRYVGKLRTLIRIQDVKPVNDFDKYITKDFCGFNILPVHFVDSKELLPDWIELVERQKLRETALEEIRKVFKKYKVKFVKATHKKETFQALENLISIYLNKKKE